MGNNKTRCVRKSKRRTRRRGGRKTKCRTRRGAGLFWNKSVDENFNNCKKYWGHDYSESAEKACERDKIAEKACERDKFVINYPGKFNKMLGYLPTHKYTGRIVTLFWDKREEAKEKIKEAKEKIKREAKEAKEELEENQRLIQESDLQKQKQQQLEKREKDQQKFTFFENLRNRFEDLIDKREKEAWRKKHGISERVRHHIGFSGEGLTRN